ncbi:hypothetical protein BT69DRAFT_1336219 [Atractiella rhizophila]|nr:hypothetical protein BT69DRAFT_1336219 [Atractiella rhizophila]
MYPSLPLPLLSAKEKLFSSSLSPATALLSALNVHIIGQEKKIAKLKEKLALFNKLLQAVATMDPSSNSDPYPGLPNAEDENMKNYQKIPVVAKVAGFYSTFYVPLPSPAVQATTFTSPSYSPPSSPSHHSSLPLSSLPTTLEGLVTSFLHARTTVAGTGSLFVPRPTWLALPLNVTHLVSLHPPPGRRACPHTLVQLSLHPFLSDPAEPSKWDQSPVKKKPRVHKPKHAVSRPSLRDVAENLPPDHDVCPFKSYPCDMSYVNPLAGELLPSSKADNREYLVKDFEKGVKLSPEEKMEWLKEKMGE